MRFSPLLILALAVTACDKSDNKAGKDEEKSSSKKKGKSSSATADYDGDESGAKKLLKKLLDDEDSREEISQALIPTDEDYDAVFDDDSVDDARKGYKKLWAQFKGAKIAPNAGQTELKLSSASTEDLKSGDGDSNKFPGGYKKVAAKFKKGLTFYAWKFVKPGETLGMAYDGLVHVNGHWAWFPKPWRAFGGE